MAEAVRRPCVLCVGGFDGSGGAGVLADVKVVEAFVVHGAAAIATMTVQNSVGVESSSPVSSELLWSQIRVLAQDLDIRVVKTGALGSGEQVEVVSEWLDYLAVPSVVDPVVLSSSGRALLDPHGLELFRRRMLPKSFLLTANASELALLSGIEVQGPRDVRPACKALHDSGVTWVLAKGGHIGHESDVVDTLFDGSVYTEFRHTRFGGPSPHGTGCVLASAVAAGLVLGMTVPEAVASGIGFIESRFKCLKNVGYGAPFLV